MFNLTNKNVLFLSNEGLVQTVSSILQELDLTAAYGAHRSTTYLAASAIEAILEELLKLLDIKPDTSPFWPKVKERFKKPDELRLDDLINIFNKAKKLPPDFTWPEEADEISNFPAPYHRIRGYRNYIHPEKEVDNERKIKQSTAQLALAGLNALIEQYEMIRFLGDYQWVLEHGLASVPQNDVVHMMQNPGDHVALLITQSIAADFTKATFVVVLEQNSIFNFVYNYHSKNNFMAARIDGRKPGDNGRLRCALWRAWTISGKYENEPTSTTREFAVEVTLESPRKFSVVVNGQPLVLQDGVDWEFDPQGKIGFMTEHGTITISDVKLIP